ncbi:non-ribosomal peptide synthetase/type I polyketide synthase [Aliiroseovarius sp. Z3]|uniref:non-ribosomal peptide synthetase/type I polyketide synthase n=1 Tax=Aliiroseovarius sp. Z3 TaxID=2811402 RepID=UPI0023B2D366|nr:non-ribosomal peptide synthetase/type I polyketide synthase [Aliiroseovarius sp. Z3]
MPYSVVSIFRSVADKHGDRAALSQGANVLSYHDLEVRSDAVAAQLAKSGVKSGSLVGMAGQRSVDTIIAALGILKADAGYVPLPEYYSDDRIRMIAKDSGLAAIVGDIPALEGVSLPKLSVDDTVDKPVKPLNIKHDPEAVAYVMYTSGTTGVPKGVVVPHRGIIRLVRDQNFMKLGTNERILQNSPIAFDASTLEIWGALLNGGTLVIPESDDTSLRGLGAIIRDQKITSMWLTAGLFHAMADERPEDFKPLRQLLTGGDVVSPDKVAKVQAACPKLTVINGYGPTENTTFTCCHKITKAQAKSGKPLPIGKPINGTEVFVVDADLQPVEDGTPGELCAAGLGLALGYLGQDDLTNEVFVPAPWDKSVRLYRTGDLVERDKKGVIRYLGRIDKQVKVRGFRVELGGIETALEQFDGIRHAAAIARAGADGADKTLVGYYVADGDCDTAALRAHLKTQLPDYAVPAHLVALDALPINDNGKVDRKALEQRALPKVQKKVAKRDSDASTKTLVLSTLSDVLEVADVDPNTNFFDLGASSLHIARVHERLQDKLKRDFPISDFFLHSTASTLSAHLSDPVTKAQPAPREAKVRDMSDSGPIAIVGLAGRYPGASSAEEMWQALMDGRELISQFSEDELDVDPSKDDPDAPYVRARGAMVEPDMFDARHFGIPPKEAERLDPQHRILLEVAQTALENAGHDPARFDGRIGVFAGSSQNSYLLNNLLSAPGASRELAMGYPVKDFATLFGNDKDFIATRIAYKLGLRGPAMTVQCACSTSLVAVAQACQALLRGDADMALAGGVSITFPTKRPYMYLPDGMASADGHCRTFDADATGTVFGDGAGIVVLRRLEDAEADGDNILAVIKGYAINNDGHDKAGYAAPSIKAQTDVIRAAHVAAGVDARSIGYIEAHGTATPLGDPIEFTALQTAFSASTDDKGFCALGSVKTNLGHLDIAAGVTGLIKTTLTLKHGVIPPLLHYKKPNPRIDFDNSAFFPVAERLEWTGTDAPRRAGVSAFGVGGTNIHMVLEEAPQVEDPATPAKDDAPRVFPISASSPDALKAAVANLGDWAKANPDADPDRVIATLRSGRTQFDQRAALVARNLSDLATAADGFTGKGIAAGQRDALAFLFPGQGAQHAGMARDLYQQEPVFREALGLCAKLLEDDLGLNLLDVIHAPESEHHCATEKLKNTALAQPAIFSIGYALAQQWRHWGITPDVMVGHSIGEFAAATIAGVIDLPDALKLIALRGRLMADLPQGVMISVRASEDEVAPYLGNGIDLAAVNGAKACVVAGPEEAAQDLLKRLETDGVVASRLHTSHAFHSQMMDPAVEPFRKAVAGLKLNAPRIPILSTVTGDWMTDDEATDPDYWAMHMRRPVRFYDAIQLLWAENRHIFLEAGPGRTMATLSGQNPDRKKAQPAIASLPAAQAENANSHDSLLSAFGELWANGYPVDWSRIDNNRPAARRLPGLPTYPFQRKRFWVEPVDVTVDYAALENTSATVEITEEAGAPQLTAGEALREMLSELSGLEPDEIDGDASFLELGFDSLLLTQAIRELSEQFGVDVALRQLIDGFPNVDALADHIEAHGTLPGAAPAEKAAPAELTKIETDEAQASPSSAPVTKIERETEELTPDQRAHIDALVDRFTAKTAKSKALTSEHRATHADPRTASGFNRLWKEIVYQIVTVKSKGSRLLDVDGNEYIDILNGFGPGFLGHSPDKVVEALHHQLDDGFEVGPQSLVAMEAAQLFCEVTGNDRASFVCTGSEAVYAAMRLARTVTNRDKIVMFARDYHGNFDEVLVRAVDGKDGPRTLPLAPGIPRDAVKNVIVLPYGTPQALDYIRKNADSLAAVIVEPVQSRRPEFRPRDFIREVRRVTERSGSLFIFDEVVTGFRFGPRGAQAYYGVDADLVTYGKVVGGGMPVGVVSGKARYMDTFDGGQWQYGDDSFPEAPVTFFAGTFVRHPLAMASLREMLRFFKSQPDLFWKTVNAKGDRLAGRVDRWFVENDMPFQMPNCGSLMYLRIGEDQKFGALLGAHMRDRGVFLLEGFPSYMTAAHNDEDIDYVVEAFKDSALEMRASGLITGREAVPYAGPKLSHVPPRLSLPGGEQQIAEEMAKPLEPLVVPTTVSQREVWGAVVMHPEVSPAYNESVTLKLQGPVNNAELVQATKQAFERHDALRSTFSDDGTEMRIAPTGNATVDEADFSDQSEADRDASMKALLRDHVTTHFDLANGPLIRAVLVKLGDDLHHLVITAHHIVCDGWSIDVIVRDIGKIYTALIEGARVDLPSPHSIVDYARVEADWARSDAAKADRDHFLEAFSAYRGSATPPVLDLPTDRPRPAVRSVAADRLDADIDPDLVAKLRKTAAGQGSTLVNLLLAAFNAYLARISGSKHVAVAVPSSGQASRGMDSLVGHCVNLMPVHTYVDPDAPFSDVLKATQTALLDASEHQHFGFGALVHALKMPQDPSRVPLTPVIFNIDNGIDLSDMQFGGAKTEFISNPRVFEQFEIFLNVTDNRQSITAEWTFNTDLFNVATIERHNTQFNEFLAALAAKPATEVKDLPLISEEQKQMLLAQWRGKMTDYPVTADLGRLFAEQLQSKPNAPALIEHGRAVSYLELDQRSVQIAQALQQSGVSVGDVVGVCLERSVDMVAAMLAAMRLGAAYLPLDPANPAARIQYIVEDSQARLVVTNRELAAQLELPNTFFVEDVPQTGGSDGASLPEVLIDPLSPAYICYTSGSTGNPKGVMGTHRATINRFVWMWNTFPFEDGEVMCQKTAISFVDSVWEIFGPLLAGVPQVIIPADTVRDPSAFLTTLADHKVSRLLVVPSLLKALVETQTNLQETIPSLKLLFCSGERLPASLARQVQSLAPDVTLVNLYGSSEVAADVTCEIVRDPDTDEIPIGTPIDNARLYILDGAGQPVPTGTVGELYVGGDVLAAGYLHRPDLTAERFLKDPFMDDPDALYFATGDLVSSLPDGRLMYHGRSDHQVKIRGSRVELGEVEVALAAQPGVSEAVATTTLDGGGDTLLLAFVTAVDGHALDAQSLRNTLADTLPDYMVPARIQVLDAMPLNPNGKTDRTALTEMSQTGPASDQPRDSTPHTPEEVKLHKIWTQLLGTNDIGIDDDYFALGGHSLMAVKLFARVKREFGVDLPIATLLSYPTIRKLATQVTSSDAPVLKTGEFEDDPWDTTAVIHAGPGDGRRPIFIAGGVGGNVNNLFELGQIVGEIRPLIGLQTRGVMGHRMHDSIEAMAADHIQNIKRHQPEGPYLLAGYSGGGFAAFEIAKQLRAQGEEVGFLGIIDVEAPGFHVDLSVPFAKRFKMEQELLRTQGARGFGTRLLARVRSKMMSDKVVRLVNKVKPDAFRLEVLSQRWVEASARYDPKPYDDDVWLVITEADGFAATLARQADPGFGWSRLVNGKLRLATHPSNHLEILKGDAARDLAGMMEQEIRLRRPDEV